MTATHPGTMLPFGSYGSRDEAAAAIGADMAQHVFDAVGAERALIAADARLGGFRRQVPVAALAVGSKGQH